MKLRDVACHVGGTLVVIAGFALFAFCVGIRPVNQWAIGVGLFVVLVVGNAWMVAVCSGLVDKFRAYWERDRNA